MKYVVIVRGKLKGGPDQAGKVHDEIIAKLEPVNKPMGSTGHQTYLNVQNGNEFLSTDFWDNIESIQKLYSDPNLAAEFARMFEGQPEVTIWGETTWARY